MKRSLIHKELSSLAPDWVFSEDRSFGIADRECDTAILPWHDHAYLEIYVIYNGRASQKTLRRKEMIGKGDILFFNIGEAHAVVPEQGFSYFVIAVTPKAIRHIGDFIREKRFYQQSGIARFLSGAKLGYGKISPAPGGISQVTDRCRELHAELTDRAAAESGTASLALYSILAAAARSLSGAKPITPVKSDPRIMRIMDYIQEHPDGDLSAEALSSMTSLNKSYLSRLFTASTRYTISEYIAEVRIENACRLLKTTDMPVYRIAERSGYRDLSFFHEKFRELNGRTPAEYRRKYQRKTP